jgi:hypothetical protein
MRAITGNHVIMTINGKTIGLMSNVTITDEVEMQRIVGIGDSTAVELVPGDVSYVISGDRYMAQTEALRDLGLVPENPADWLTFSGLHIEVVDRINGKTLEHYSGCKFTHHTRKYEKHAIVGENFSIVAQNCEFRGS